MKNKSRIVLAIVLLFCIAEACTTRKEELEKTCKASTGEVISFNQDILPILTSNCATSGCHRGTAPEANFNLEADKAYTQLLKSGSGYVDTLTPKFSVLYSSLISTTAPMPPNGRLDDCSLELIETWMKQGAKNN